MIQFGDATAEHIYEVSLNMRDRDFEEISCLSYETTREDLARYLADSYGGLPFVFSFCLDGKPVCIWMGIAIHPGVWSIGMWATSDLPKIAKFVSRITSNELFGAMRTAGAHRVECKSIVGYDSVHKWLRFLGFREQNINGVPVVTEKFGKDGQDFLTFEWVEGMPWPRGYTAETQGRVLEPNSISGSGENVL